MPTRTRDYAALEREFVTGDMSVRELCRTHGIPNHSVVHEQARKRDWVGKRLAYQDQRTDRTMAKIADRRADIAAREVDVREHAIEAIDEAIQKMRDDMRRTRIEMQDGNPVEVPVMTIKPTDLALLIDRLNVLFGRPSAISEERSMGISVAAEATPADLRRILDLTAGVAGADTGRGAGSTALPRVEGPRTN
jgi:hypothetical protein